ncbi:MAG TPA: hypothetical protein VMF30_07655, partial [Pirellulales bacterium]|nr:hypothetical protein [Pirellulales bacterium]
MGVAPRRAILASVLAIAFQGTALSAEPAAAKKPAASAPAGKASPSGAQAPADKPAGTPAKDAKTPAETAPPLKVTTPAVPATLDTYVQPDGSGFFALVLPAETNLANTPGHDVVVLFDTSASQIGEARSRGLKALDTLLAGCEATDRVALMAVDVTALPLTTGFVAPGSSDLKAAVEKLHRRVPLGATDLPLALERAAAAFSDGDANGKAVVYIGDGVSGAQLLTPPSFARLSERLVEQHVPVTSYGLGPKVDDQLLAALANYTGGTLVLDAADVDPKAAGLFLAASARAAVAWVAANEWPQTFEAHYPRRLMPQRSDRETVIIGRGKIEGTVSLAAVGEAAGRPWQRRWTANAGKPSDDFS